MNISNELLSLVREHKPLIQGISETAAFIPVEGNVADEADDGGYDPESSRRRILLQYALPAITVVGSLLELVKKSSIALKDELKNLKDPKGINALQKARCMNLLTRLLRGRAMTGATGVRNSSGKTDVASSIDNIKLSSKKQKFAKKEIIAKDKGEVWDEKVIGLRICTDGKPTKMFKDNKKYGDKSHKDTTACFTGDKSDVSDISADKIPYIVVPKTEKGIEYKYSVGVIVNLKGDYLYCVVAEVGPVDKGLGEVSIYAAWKMKGWKVPPDVKKEGKINEKYCIGEKTQYQYKGPKKHRHKVPWRIILFKTSAPYKKGEINWQCNDTEKLKEQIILEGKKCYTGTGECLN